MIKESPSAMVKRNYIYIIKKIPSMIKIPQSVYDKENTIYDKNTTIYI